MKSIFTLSAVLALSIACQKEYIAPNIFSKNNLSPKDEVHDAKTTFVACNSQSKSKFNRRSASLGSNDEFRK
jgi:hypothetical protein